MVALAHFPAKDWLRDRSGFARRKRPFVEVSGRKGLGVKADDLIDRVIDKASSKSTGARANCRQPNGGRSPEQIAIAAVRYFLHTSTPAQGHRFDIDER